MQRVTVALALALQLLGCVAPANAFILCVSDDGCVEIELAQPGTRRCAETDCDAGHGGDPAHACRDVPILNTAVAAARVAVGDGSVLAAVLLPAEVRLDQPAPPLGPPAARAAAPPALPPHRTVVLQL